MKIAIIIKYSNINSFENLKFRSTCSDMGVSLSILDRDKFSVILDNEISIYYDNEPLKDFDYIIPRTGSATLKKDAHIYNCIRLAGYNILNDGDAILTLMDKFKVHSLLVANGIPTIKSMTYKDNDDLNLIDSNFSYPLIVKSNTGSLGWGIYKVNNFDELKNMLNMAFMSSQSSYYIIQEFVADDIGVDYRVFMCGNQVISSMKRSSNNGDFIANFTKHNKSEKFEVDDEVTSICQKVMKILNCDIAGIDLMIKDGSYVVCEVNSAPGFKGLEHANSGLNTVKELVNILKKTKANEL